MATFRNVIYNTIETLKQTSDDVNLQPFQVMFWISVIVNRLRAQTLEKEASSFYMTTFPCVDVLVSTQDCVPGQPGIVKGRKYIVLPKPVYDLFNEGGIAYITYCSKTACCNPPAFTQVQFTPTQPMKAERLYMNPYEEPTPSNPYFYGSENIIYFLGLECVTMKCVEIGLFTVLDPNTQCDLDEEIPLDEKLISVLMYELLNLGRFIFMTPSERINQGADTPTEQQNAVVQQNQIPQQPAQEQTEA